MLWKNSLKYVVTDSLYVVKKFFNYDNDELLGNLVYSCIIAFRVCLDEYEIEIEKLLKRRGINLPIPKFIQQLEEAYKYLSKLDSNILQSDFKHAPTSIQGHPHLWTYYAMYWIWPNIINFTETKEEVPSKWAFIAIQYHLEQIVYEEFNNENIKSKDKLLEFFKGVSIGVTRGIEIIGILYRKKNELDQIERDYIELKYFDETIDDWLDNFFKIVVEDPIESTSYFIQTESSKNNYINYRNEYYDIGPWHFKTTRRTAPGNSNNKSENKNLINFIKRNALEHNKLRKQQSSNKHGTGGGGSRGSVSQYTVEEPYLASLEENIDKKISSTIKEEYIEQHDKKKYRYRAFPDEQDENSDFIANLRQQQKKNRAFSAKVAKRTLLLKTDYEVPNKEHLRSFIDYLMPYEKSEVFTKEEFFRTTFILSIIAGQEVSRIINGIYFGKSNMLEFIPETYSLKMGIDPSLFSKDKSGIYLEKAKNYIQFRLPYPLVLLISKLRINIDDLDDNEKLQLKSEEIEEEYIAFIKQHQKSFHKKIKINLKQTWRIVATYCRSLLLEDMSALLCMAHYQTSDKPRLAYTVTQKEAQVFSKHIEYLYRELGLNNHVCNMLNVSPEIFNESVNKNEKISYSGSKRAANPEKVRAFFNQMSLLYYKETDKYKKFNLFSIAMRYALSILLGTRTFKMSDNFSKMAMNTIVISEKAETLIGGIRIIPVCEIAEKLISRYKMAAKQLGYDVINTSLYINNKLVPFQKEASLKLLSNYEVADTIIKFVRTVPLNTGRHIISKYAIAHNFNGFYLEALLGHYTSGGEQQGIFSTLDMRDYIYQCQKLLDNVARVYGVDCL